MTGAPGAALLGQAPLAGVAALDRGAADVELEQFSHLIVVREVLVQPIRTQQQPVAGHEWQRADVDLHLDFWTRPRIRQANSRTAARRDQRGRQ